MIYLCQLSAGTIYRVRIIGGVLLVKNTITQLKIVYLKLEQKIMPYGKAARLKSPKSGLRGAGTEKLKPQLRPLQQIKKFRKSKRTLTEDEQQKVSEMRLYVKELRIEQKELKKENHIWKKIMSLVEELL